MIYFGEKYNLKLHLTKFIFYFETFVLTKWNIDLSNIIILERRREQQKIC